MNSIRYRIDVSFLVASILSLATLPFFRFEIGTFQVPAIICIFFVYVYIKVLLETIGGDLFRVNDKVIALALYMFLLLIFVSLIATGNMNWRNFLEIVLYVVFVFVVSQKIRIRIQEVGTLLMLLMLVLAFLTAWGVGNFLLGHKQWFQFTVFEDAGFGSRNVDVYTVIPGFTIGIVSLLMGRGKLIVALLSVGIISFGIAISLSRGGLAVLVVSFVVSTAFAFIIAVKRGRIKLARIARLICFVAVLGGMSTYIADSYREEVVNRYIDRYAATGESVRLPLVAESLEIMLEHPLSGIGFNNYREYSAYEVGQAHNAYLNFGSETGVFGFLTIVFLFAYPLIRFWRIGRMLRLSPSMKGYEWIHVVGMTLCLYLAVINFFNTFYLDAGHIFWFYYSLALIILYSIERTVSDAQNG